MTQKNILEMKKIVKKFPGVTALNQVDFSCREGEIHALIGENGAGKSTLIKLLSGASYPTSGEILFKGKPFHAGSPIEAMRKGIAIIYQELNLITNLNAYENIFLGREPKKGIVNDFKKMREEALAYLSYLNVEINVDVPVGALSVAQQQMIEIAKALSMNAELLIMDEPTSSLTTAEIESLFKVMRDLKEKGVTIIFISHHLDELFEISDRVTVLKDGEYIATKNIDELTEAQLINMMVGRELSEIYPPKAEKIGDVVLEVRNLSSGSLLHNISFCVRQGEIVGISGLMGAGRTELAEAVFGVRKRSSGEIIIHGEKVRHVSPKQSLKAKMGFLTEDRKEEGLFLDMTVSENIVMSMLPKISKAAVISKKREKEITSEFIQQLRIKTPTSDTKVVNLSGGNQQKVVLAKWLACQSNIIILDEPTRGIDVGAKMEIYNEMRRLANEGKAILMISSEMPEIIGMSDRVLVMREGVLTGEIGKEEMTEQNILTYAMGGLNE